VRALHLTRSPVLNVPRQCLFVLIGVLHKSGINCYDVGRDLTERERERERSRWW
jgi:hypothetical protein